MTHYKELPESEQRRLGEYGDLADLEAAELENKRIRAALAANPIRTARSR